MNRENYKESTLYESLWPDASRCTFTRHGKGWEMLGREARHGRRDIDRES